MFKTRAQTTFDDISNSDTHLDVMYLNTFADSEIVYPRPLCHPIPSNHMNYYRNIHNNDPIQPQEKTGSVFINKVKRFILITLMIAYMIFSVIVEIGCLYVHYIIIGYLKVNKMYWAIGFIMAKLIIQFGKGLIKGKKMYRERSLKQKKQY
jgi:hypothetical protein